MGTTRAVQIDAVVEIDKSGTIRIVDRAVSHRPSRPSSASAIAVEYWATSPPTARHLS
jgi:hypothetical protein